MTPYQQRRSPITVLSAASRSDRVAAEFRAVAALIRANGHGYWVAGPQRAILSLDASDHKLDQSTKLPLDAITDVNQHATET